MVHYFQSELEPGQGGKVSLISERANPNRYVLRLDLKGDNVLVLRSDGGYEFQSLGPHTEKQLVQMTVRK